MRGLRDRVHAPRKTGRDWQKRRAQDAMAVPVVRICRRCGAEFTRQRTLGSPRAYCSDECRRLRVNREALVAKKRPAKCMIEDCPEPRRSRKADWCEKHYARNRRYGSPHATVNRVANLKCHHCGIAVSRRAMFCSELCRRRDRMNAPCLRLACMVCDAQLSEDAPLGTKFCSVDCKFMAGRARQYGISPRELRALLMQTDSCQICGTPCPDLVVDHCHANLRVRGLLCGQCNLAIGMFAEDPARMRAAADYIEHHAALA